MQVILLNFILDAFAAELKCIENYWNLMLRIMNIIVFFFPV
jgi:hypothetical protein